MSELKDLDVSIVVPVYNSMETLDELVARLAKVLTSTVHVFEIILVNDGSSDASWEKICQLAKKYKQLKGVNLMRNYGQHNALLCGTRKAQYPIIVTLDDDLQNPPEQIPQLLLKLQKGYDVVYGYPEKEKHGLWRVFSSIFAKFVLSCILREENLRAISSFRAINAVLKQGFFDYQGTYVFFDALLLRNTSRIGKINLSHVPRKAGKSNYNIKLLMLHGINMLFGSSIFPLRIANILGVLIAGFGLLVFLYVIVHYYFMQVAIPGFTFLAAIISIFSGTQLIILGIIGEYLGRMYFKSIHNSAYLVRESISGDLNADITLS